ncbi:glycerophosphodiester phosphodiesterase family protein [Limibacillus halophilus]
MQLLKRSQAGAAYARAWRRRASVIPLFVGIRLLSLAVVLPLTGVVVSLAVGLSGQSALTDQDILRFLLTPLGFAAGCLAVSVLLIGSVVGLAAMTLDLRSDRSGTLSSIASTASLLALRLPALLGYAVLLIARALAIMLPFLLAALVAAKVLIGSHDINYYLAERPPEFLLTLLIAGLFLLVMALLLVRNLLAWAVSLHLVFFDRVPPWKSFALSREKLTGRRGALFKDVLVWLGLRLILSGAVAAVFALLLQFLPGLFLEHLRTALSLILVLMALWVLADLIAAAISQGALAEILNRRFGEAREALDIAAPAVRLLSPKLLLAATAALVVLGFALGALLIEKLEVAQDDAVVIAHRGAAGSRPENTLASVRKALEDGADWVEIDVQESADGEVIVIHDSDFMKLAGVDIKVWDATREDLEGIDIGSWFDPAYASERTPLLREVLEVVRDRAKLLIELKYYGHDVALEAKTVAIVEEAGMSDQVATMSLKYPAVQKMLALRPNWPSGVLAATAVGDLTRLEGDFIAINAGQAGRGLASAARKAGKELYLWTVNDPLQMSAAFSMGVSGIITDEPALAREVLAVRAGLSLPERFLLLLAERLGLSLPVGVYRDQSP